VICVLHLVTRLDLALFLLLFLKATYEASMAYCVNSEDVVNEVEIEIFNEENYVTSFTKEKYQESICLLKFTSLKPNAGYKVTQKEA